VTPHRILRGCGQSDATANDSNDSRPAFASAAVAGGSPNGSGVGEGVAAGRVISGDGDTAIATEGEGFVAFEVLEQAIPAATTTSPSRAAFRAS
jgi:hypothetical protein